jgi:hypothetical protein
MAIKLIQEGKEFYIRFKEFKQKRCLIPTKTIIIREVTEENKESHPDKEIGDTYPVASYDYDNMVDVRNILLNVEVCDYNNRNKKQFTNIKFPIPYKPTISETDIYNELRQRNITIKDMYGDDMVLNLPSAEDVLEEGQPDL